MSYCRRAAQRDGPPFFSAGAQTPPEKWAREAPPADAESRHRAATSAEAFLDYSPGGQPEESPRPTASRTPPVAERQNYETFPSISSTVNYLLVLKKTMAGLAQLPGRGIPGQHSFLEPVVWFRRQFMPTRATRPLATARDLAAFYQLSYAIFISIRMYF